jgi:hypothetical protein
LLGKLELLVWILAVSYVMLMATPASFWYDAGDLLVRGPLTDDHGEIVIEYNGGARRDTEMSYSVVVREVTRQEIITEDVSGVFLYSKDATRPDPLYMSWWSPRSFGSDLILSEGVYQVETCWTVVKPFFGIVPPKTVCLTSNIFYVKHEENV